MPLGPYLENVSCLQNCWKGVKEWGDNVRIVSQQFKLQVIGNVNPLCDIWIMVLVHEVMRVPEHQVEHQQMDVSKLLGPDKICIMNVATFARRTGSVMYSNMEHFNSYVNMYLLNTRKYAVGSMLAVTVLFLIFCRKILENFNTQLT